MQRAILPVVLLVVAVAALVASNRADDAPEPPSVVIDAPSPVTPVLSVRRTPELLVGRQAQDALAEELGAVITASPSDTCLVVDDAGDRIYAHNAQQFVVPASNLKVVTALAALEQLGPEHRYRTRVVVEGSIVDGVVQGNLIIVGSGDPVIATELYLVTFDERRIRLRSSAEELADSVAATGITQITGSVLGDDWRYDDERVVSTWPERYASQGQVGPLSALSLNDGFVAFPESTDLNLGLPPPVRADDPASHFAASFVDLLAQRGVTVLGGSGRTQGPTSITDKEEVAVLESPPLREIVQAMVAGSDNNTAELLLKELGLRRANAGTTFNGLVAVTEILAEAGYAVQDLAMFDGSGLDPSNRVTCGLMASVLGDAEHRETLDASMAVAGESGTLVDRFIGTTAEGALRAKTGFLNNATGLSGYVTTAPGTELAFSYIANTPDDQTVTLELIAVQDLLAETLMRYPVGPDLAQLGPQPLPAG